METHLLEYRILSLLRHRDAYLKYSPVVKEHLFETKESKYLLKLIKYYHSQVGGKNLVPLNALYTLVNSRAKENESKKYKDIIRKVKKYPMTDLSIADDIVKRFTKRQLVKMVVLDAVAALEKEDDIDISKFISSLSEATLIESSDLVDSGYDYFTNPSQRLKEDGNEKRIATGYPKLDKAMRGGLSAGEIGIVVAPTSVGKTIKLINYSYNAMKQGCGVVYVTLELSGRKIAGRFDQLVAQRTYEEIERDPLCVYRATKQLAKKGAGLVIKDCTASKLSPQDLGVYLERLRKNFKFDLVVVDQIDLMYSPKEYKERRFELSSIIIALRRLGATLGIPVWSASQATRIAGAAGNTTLWDIAEDIGKANWADVIITLSQSPEDKEDNIMIAQIAKNRIGEGNPEVLLEVDYSLMTVKEAKKIDVEHDGEIAHIKDRRKKKRRFKK